MIGKEKTIENSSLLVGSKDFIKFPLFSSVNGSYSFYFCEISEESSF